MFVSFENTNNEVDFHQIGRSSDSILLVDLLFSFAIMQSRLRPYFEMSLRTSSAL